MLLTAVFWPVTAIVRRRFGAGLALGSDALRAYRLSKIGSILLLAGLGTSICLAQSPAAKPQQESATPVPRITILRTPRAAVLRSVRVTSDAEGPAARRIESDDDKRVGMGTGD